MHLLHTALQIETWNRTLVGLLDDIVREEEVLKDEKPHCQRTTIFVVKLKAMHYVQDQRLYNKDS